MTAPPAALRGQDPDRWARRAAIGFGVAMAVGFFVPVHRTTLDLLLWLKPDVRAAEWNWPWDWMPRVRLRILGTFLAFPAIGLLAFAAAVRRKHDRMARELLACGLALGVAWSARVQSTYFPVRSWAMNAWNLGLPPLAIVLVWSGATLRRRHPAARTPRLWCLLGGLALLAYLTVPAFDREPFSGAFSRRTLSLVGAILPGLGAALAVAGLISAASRPSWARAHLVTQVLAWAVVVAVPVAIVLEWRRILGRLDVFGAWSQPSDLAWFLIGVRSVLLCAGALGLGSVGVAAYAGGWLERAAARTKRRELEEVFD